jgi:hypothetical protein
MAALTKLNGGNCLLDFPSPLTPFPLIRKGNMVNLPHPSLWGWRVIFFREWWSMY